MDDRVLWVFWVVQNCNQIMEQEKEPGVVPNRW